MKKSFICLLLSIIALGQTAFGAEKPAINPKISPLASKVPLMHLNDIIEANYDIEQEILLIQRLADYYGNGKLENACEYLGHVTKICSLAKEQLLKLTPTEKSVIVFDIDETALTRFNYYYPQFIGSYQKYLKIRDPRMAIHPDRDLIYELPAVLDLYNTALKLGIKCIFLSISDAADIEDRISELEATGFKHYAKLILPSTEQYECMLDEPHFIGQWKLEQRKKLAETHEIIMCVGDQDSDFEGGFTGIEVRIPNYMRRTYKKKAPADVKQDKKAPSDKAV
ncbi:MAG TPA: HAD family acid phosphatase [Candidatus Babeliales bacterium]|nr:HAD family acid phosphatase [Candidatus Babeliales bacterium]